MSVYVSDQSPLPRRIRFDWISEAFSIYGKNVGVWIGSILLYFVGAILLSLLIPRPDIHSLTGGNPLASAASAYTPQRTLASNLLNLVLAAIFSPGLFSMANKQVRGEQISIADLFGNYGRAIPVVLYHIVNSILLFVGFILCLIPGFFIFMLFWPGFALVADGVPIGEALSRSFNGVKNDLLSAGLFAFVLILLVIVSVIPCGLGLFVTVPMMYIIASLAYRDMIGMPGTGTDNLLGGPYYATPNTAGGVWPPAPTQGVPPATNPFPPVTNPFPPITPAPPANPPDAFPPPTDPYSPPPPPNPPQSGV